MPSKSIINCSQLLKDRGLTIAFAESATAGRLASEFSLTENSGSILKGGLVCYDAEVKTNVLGVDPKMIEKYTAESEQVTKEMAKGLQKLIESDIQVAITGLTTPGGSESAVKPVGTFFMHVLLKKQSLTRKKVFEGTPEQMVLQTADFVAQIIINALKD
jgi:nicotinamide-nucleotide amidase